MIVKDFSLTLRNFFPDNFQNHGNHVQLKKPLEKIGELQQLKQVILE